jgi:hypothetical protein
VTRRSNSASASGRFFEGFFVPQALWISLWVGFGAATQLLDCALLFAVCAKNGHKKIID